jgi:site-specific DNA-methyltransferase (adenine-specific)
LPDQQTSLEWDRLINYNDLWSCYNRIIKDTGNIVLFASGTFTFDLYASNSNNFRYRLIWKKNVPTGMSSAKTQPMRYFEDILIFKKPNAIVNNITYNPQMKERIGEHKECYNYNHYCGKSNHVDYDKKQYQYDPNKVQPSNILEFNVVPNRNGKLHPTQKPVDLLQYLIKTYSNDNDFVLDNCMGSGSTGVACIKSNRNFIGIELDKSYFDIAENRLKQEELDNKRKLF